MQQIPLPGLLSRNRMAAEGYTKQRSEYDPASRFAWKGQKRQQMFRGL
jgi:hypothetical protein